MVFPDIPSAPTGVQPANGSTKDTSRPTLLAVVQSGGDAQVGTYRAKWEMATNITFTTGVKSIADPEADLIAAGGSASEVTPTAQATTQGTRYVRAATISDFGYISAWSSTNTFTVAHAPTTYNHLPSGGYVNGLTGVTFSWDFADTYPDDTQTAYEVYISKVSDGSLAYDSGKVTSSAKFHALTTELASFVDMQLRWRVRVYDADDVVGPWSTYISFMPTGVPTGNITFPDNEPIDNPVPTITWTFTPTGGRAQTSYEITITDTATNTTAYWSGKVTSAATSHTVSDGTALKNSHTYSIKLTVTDTVGVTDDDVTPFTTDWVPPDAPPFTVVTADTETNGFVTILWDDDAQDATFYSYRLYRRTIDTDAVWQLVTEVSTIQPEYAYEDWTASAGYNEWALVQVATRYGAPVESEYVPILDFASFTDYWLVHPTDTTKNLRLYYVTADAFTDVMEREDVALIGQGRHVDLGTALGVQGTISGTVWDRPEATAHEQRLALQELFRSKTKVMLRNPFGDNWQVTLGDPSFDRVAAGPSEYHTFSLPYSEVV
jgi:hypothetical protein